MPDLYPIGLHVDPNTRCISYNGYNERFVKLNRVKLEYLATSGGKPYFRVAHCYGFDHPEIVICNCQGPGLPPDPNFAIMEIVDCNNFGCEAIYIGDNNALGIRVVGLSGINPDFAKHWITMLSLDIVSQGNKYDEFKYISNSDIKYYVERGSFTSGKTTIKQCHDVNFRLTPSDLTNMIDIDKYTLGLCKIDGIQMLKPEILERKREPYSEKNPANNKNWANVVTVKDTTRIIVLEPHFENCKVYLFPELFDKTFKSGDGLEVTCEIEIKLPTPSTGEIIGWYYITSDQQNGNQTNLVVPFGQTTNKISSRILGGWENLGTKPLLMIGGWPSMPIGTELTVKDLKVAYYG